MTDKTAFPSDAADKVLVRMPDGMRDRLKEAAKANNRTMNAEIISRLQDSFPAPPESGAWEKAFPYAAQANRGEAMATQIQQETHLLKHLQIAQLQAKFESLMSQVMSMETQSTTLHLQVIQLDYEAARAKQIGEQKIVTSAQTQIRALRAHMSEINLRMKTAMDLAYATEREISEKKLVL